MSSQRYERVNAHDEDYESQSHSAIPLHPSSLTPSSPPPSFRSHSSSPRHSHTHTDSSRTENADQTLADAFGEASDSEDDDEPDDRQRLMRANPESRSAADSDNNVTTTTAEENTYAQRNDPNNPSLQRRPTMLPSFGSSAAGPGRAINSNDGVFANLDAKPERGEKNEDLPPSYEEAAADASPPYWETTILAPGISSDEVFVDGLPVGSIFSFVWNAMISMSFQLVGFLLTYLLHTTHAAKNGSRAGLGLTLVQYGFYMKGGSEPKGSDDGGSDQYVPPPDPNSHNFDPNNVNESGGGDGGASSAVSAISTSEWISYILMIVGWFILIRAISDFLRARRHEQLVLQSPERGLNVPVIAEGERSETVV